jgi:hypothetical protein
LGESDFGQKEAGSPKNRRATGGRVGTDHHVITFERGIEQLN